MREIKFSVPGEPRPKGSASPFVVGWKPGQTSRPRAVVAPASKHLKAWEKKVKQYAQVAMAPEPLRLSGAIRLSLIFFLQRPKSHFVGGRVEKGNVKPKHKDDVPLKDPDADKLARAAIDGLQNIVFGDDNTVIDLCVFKRWGVRPGVKVIATELTTQTMVDDPEQLLFDLMPETEEIR